MKTNLFLLCIILFSFSSCQKESDLELYFIDKTKKWVFIDYKEYNPNSVLISYIKFEKNKCQNFDADTDLKSGPKGLWEYSSKDSILIVFKNKFKVLKIQEDTITVKHKNHITLFINLNRT
jgi:hypothetical protein